MGKKKNVMSRDLTDLESRNVSITNDEPRFTPAVPAPAPAPLPRRRQRWQSRSSAKQSLNPLQVDSWRSYPKDTANLQSLSNQVQETLSNRLVLGTTQPENPGQQQRRPQQFTRYSPLRVSGGTLERQVVQQAKQYSTSKPTTLCETTYSNDPTTNYAVPDSDTVLPSTEKHLFKDAQFDVAITRDSTQIAIRSLSETPEPPPAPTATVDYCYQAQLDPFSLPKARKLLVVLDLNGTLIFRKHRAKDPTVFQIRPGVSSLLEYLFRNHAVMIYTSVRPENARVIVNKLLAPHQCKSLVAVWARDRLGLTKAQYNSKVQVYKNLQHIWSDKQIQAAAEKDHRWDQTNTVLVDDSKLKALAQPHNLLQIPEFINDRPTTRSSELTAWENKQQAIVKQLQLKLDELRWANDVSQLIRLWQNQELETPTIPGQVTAQIARVTQNTIPKRESSANSVDENVQLLTPKSPFERVDDLDTYSDEETTMGLKHLRLDAKVPDDVDNHAEQTSAASRSNEQIQVEHLGETPANSIVETPATPKSIN